jgi:cyclophilin family peptidyl-prolyl cis-trans isomerase
MTLSITESIGFIHAAFFLSLVGCALTGGKASAAEPNPQVLFKTSKGDVLIELYEDEAPNTVANFVNLVEKKFYDGVKFHRVIKGFMAQGGDPTGTGAGGPGHVIDCECALPNARRHQRGSLSMAHRGKNTGGSQFFLCFVPTAHLDGKHTVFGQVVEGMENVDNLQERDPQAGGPADTIVSATVVRKRNHDYKPKTNPGN